MGDRDKQPDVAAANIASEDVSGEAGGQQQRCLPEQAPEAEKDTIENHLSNIKMKTELRAAETEASAPKARLARK